VILVWLVLVFNALGIAAVIMGGSLIPEQALVINVIEKSMNGYYR